MSHYSIDIETLGTNFNDTILSIGVCEFEPSTGYIKRTIEITFDIPENETIPCTIGTLRFWLYQAVENPKAVCHVFDNINKTPTRGGLLEISNFLKAGDNTPEMWANGTKFDLGMVEHMYKSEGLNLPWKHNADRCMRTLRRACGHIDIDMGEYSEISHTALSDAVWQAKYISACLCKLGITL